MLYGLWRMERPACDAHLWALTGPVCQWWYGSVSKGNLEWLKGTLVLDGWHLVRMATGRGGAGGATPVPAPNSSPRSGPEINRGRNLPRPRPRRVPEPRRVPDFPWGSHTSK